MPVLGVVEVLIGLGLAARIGLRIVLLALIAQMLGTFLVFLVLPDVAFRDGNPLMLTVEGGSCSRTWSYSPRQWSSGRRWTVPGDRRVGRPSRCLGVEESVQCVAILVGECMLGLQRLHVR